MTRRATHLLLEGLLGLVALVVVLAGVFAWRLSSGPIAVSFLNPFMEQAFDKPGNDIQVSVGDTILRWDSENREIDLLLQKWRLNDAEGRRLASLPETEVTLSLPALFRGKIAPSRIGLTGVRLRLLRDARGNFVWDKPAPQAREASVEGEAAVNEIAPDILTRMVSAPDPSDPLSYLETVEVRQGRLLVVDRRLGVLLRAPSVNLTLHRGGPGLLGSGTLVLRGNGRQAEVQTALTYDAHGKLLSVSTNLADFHPLILAGLGEAMAPTAGIDLPLDAFVELRLRAARLESVAFDVTTGAGRIELPGVLPGVLEVLRLSARGRFLAGPVRLELDGLEVALAEGKEPGPRLAASGTATWRPGAIEVAAEASLSELAADQLARFWPAEVADGGRTWVSENISAGVARDAKIAFALALPGGLATKPPDPVAVVTEVEIHRASGGFAYSGLTAHYLRPMPPVTDIEGTATFDLTGLTFEIGSGRLGELSVSGGKIRLLHLEKPVQAIDIALPISGPLQAALELLDNPRLGLLSKLGLGPEGAEGQAKVTLAIGLPLLNDLPIEQVAISATGSALGAALPKAAFGQDLRNGDLDLKVDQNGMEISGDLTLAGIPLTAHWRERFFSSEGPETKIVAKVPRLDPADLAILGFDGSAYFKGSLAADVDLEQDRGGPLKIGLDADLAQADLTFAPLGWRKSAGTPGRARAVFLLQGDKLIAIEDLAATADRLELRGRADFDPASGDLRGAQVPRLAIGATDLTDVRLTKDGAALAAVLGGGTLDLSPLLDGLEAPSSAPTAAPDPQHADPPSLEPPPPLELSTPGLERVILGEDRYVEALAGSLRRSTQGWESLKAAGRLPAFLRRLDATAAAPPPGVGPASFSVDYGPDPQGQGFKLAARTDDMGALLRVIGLMDSMEGGDLLLEGNSPGPLPGAPLTARIESQDFRLRRAPVMGRLLTLASLTGISDTLSGEGIAFQRLVGDFRVENDLLSSDLIRAYGSAIGLTAKGKVDLAGEGTEVIGTIVPAYSVNKVLGSIPVLGWVLTGGEGEGVLAVTYAVRGSIRDPKLSVNPLSVLAPGFLRSLFSAPGAESLPEALPPPGKEQ